MGSFFSSQHIYYIYNYIDFKLYGIWMNCHSIDGFSRGNPTPKNQPGVPAMLIP